MKTWETPHQQYISGPHSDYYLLLDEEADTIFAMRLAKRIREARGKCDDRSGLAADSLPEIWIDHGTKQVWYVFDASCAEELADNR